MILFYFMLCCELTKVLAETSPSNVFPPHYDKVDPPHNKGNPAHVYLDLRVMDVDRIDEGLMEFSIQCYIAEYWKDTRLNLSIQSTESNPRFPDSLVKRLWTPDLVFDNAKTGVLFSLSIPNTHVHVLEGTFIRSTRYNLVISCQMNFYYYPMDTQECFLKMSPLANPERKATLHWADEVTNPKKVPKSIRFTNDIQPLKYRILPPKAYKTREQWIAGNYTYLYANFTFVRRISGSLVNVYVPSTLVVSLSWISFWLDVTAVPGRITLGVTSLLTLATQVVQARNGLPSISYMTAMDIWLFVCLITAFGSLLEYAFTYQMYFNNRKFNVSGRHPPTNTEKLERNQLRFRKSPNELLGKSIPSNFRKSTLRAQERKCFNELNLDRFCRRLFPIMFAAFAAFYWTYYLWFM